MSEAVLVVGVGPGGRTTVAPSIQARILQADWLVGSARLLAEWPDFAGRRSVLGANVAELVAELRARGAARVAVLGSGDPGFNGIGSTLLRELPRHEVEIVPNVSSLQLVCARAGVAWDQAVFVSAHAQPLADVVGWSRRAAVLGVLTDPTHTPAAIARTLLDAGLDDCRTVVGENLGATDERVTETRLSELPGRSFASLSVLLLVRPPAWRPRPSFAPRPDESYAHRRGLITKADIRALCLARLALAETDVVWDVGAGSGAMSIEMAELAWRGRVYAVERDAENLEFVRQNCARFGALNVAVVAGEAPAALQSLPPPDAVFVGGTGGQMPEILAHVGAHVGRVAVSGCRVVMCLATLEHLHEALTLATALGWSPRVTQASLAHGQAIAGLTRLAPLNPVFIVSLEVL